MSDPVTNIEIEDVLSSIRRLVSNGKSGRAGAPSESRPDVPPDVPPDERLVLTPALRVDDDTPRPAEPDGFIWKDLVGDAKTGGQTGAADEMPEAEPTPEPDLQDLSEERSAQGGGLFQSRRAPRPRHDLPPEIEAEPPQFQSEGAVGENRDDAPLGLEAQAAEFEAAVASRDDQWDPDGISDGALAGQPVPTLDWRDASEDTDDTPNDTGLAPEIVHHAPDWTPKRAPAPVDLEPEDHEGAAQVEEDTPVSEQVGDHEATPSGLSLDETVLDEDSLRDLVAEIVREELQGALGERITRNVRKLVRREIHRALTSEDFD